MAIQNRRGSYSDFAGGANLVDGEFGMVQSGDTNTADGTGVYAAPVAGTVHRLLMDDDKTELAGDIADNASDISSINGILTNMSSSVSNTEGTSVSTTNGSWTLAQSATLTKGVYLVVFGGKFGIASDSGYRQICMTNSSAPSTLPVQSVSVPVAPNVPTSVNMTRPIEVTGSSLTLNLYARQNSGGALSFDPFIRYVRLR